MECAAAIWKIEATLYKLKWIDMLLGIGAKFRINI